MTATNSWRISVDSKMRASRQMHWT